MRISDWSSDVCSSDLLQDREDDALIGVRSSALRMGRHVRSGTAGFYILALALWAAAIWQVRADPLAFVALAPVALHFCWQVATLPPEAGATAPARFLAHRLAGLLILSGCVEVGRPACMGSVGQ